MLSEGRFWRSEAKVLSGHCESVYVVKQDLQKNRLQDRNEYRKEIEDHRYTGMVVFNKSRRNDVYQNIQIYTIIPYSREDKFCKPEVGFYDFCNTEMLHDVSQFTMIEEGSRTTNVTMYSQHLALLIKNPCLTSTYFVSVAFPTPSDTFNVDLSSNMVHYAFGLTSVSYLTVGTSEQ